MEAVLQRADLLLRAAGVDTMLDDAEAFPAVWAAASPQEQSALQCGLIPLSETKRPILPVECVDVFGPDAFPYDRESKAAVYEGVNIGALLGEALAEGAPLETAFDRLVEFNGNLIGPLACAVARALEEVKTSAS